MALKRKPEQKKEKKLSKREELAIRKEQEKLEAERLEAEMLQAEREKLLKLSEKELLVELLLALKHYDKRITILEKKINSADVAATAANMNASLANMNASLNRLNR